MRAELLEDITRVMPRNLGVNEEEQKSRRKIPIVAFVCLLLLTAPKGAVVEIASSMLGFGKSAATAPSHPSETHYGKQERTSIHANNSKVNNVQVNNYGGAVNIDVSR